MNIFVLDTDPVLCAQYHFNKHLPKMVLETTQLLNNALSIVGPSYTPIYRTTHLNHPCTKWASYSKENFQWLLSLGFALSEEYTYRYGKRHACHQHLDLFAKPRQINLMPTKGAQPFVKCMPEYLKVADPVQSYRNYYRNAKAYMAFWRKRPIPEWWNTTPLMVEPPPRLKTKKPASSLQKYAEGWDRIFGRKHITLKDPVKVKPVEISFEQIFPVTEPVQTGGTSLFASTAQTSLFPSTDINSSVFSTRPLNWNDWT